MVLPLAAAGIGMMGVGTAMNLIGTHQRDKATRRALKAYQSAINQKADQDRAALNEEQGLLYGLAGERQRGIGGYLNELAMAQRPGTDEGFMERQRGVLTDIGRQTGGMDSSFAYSGTPRTQATQQQGMLTSDRNRRLAEALLADHEVRQIDERERAAQTRMSLGELLRGVKGKSMQEKFSLARALRDLDWQRKTAAMQGQLDEAQRKGQWLNVLGGLSTQAGGLMALAGLAGGGGAVDAGGAATYGGGTMPGPAVAGAQQVPWSSTSLWR